MLCNRFLCFATITNTKVVTSVFTECIFTTIRMLPIQISLLAWVTWKEHLQFLFRLLIATMQKICDNLNSHTLKIYNYLLYGEI